MPRRLEEKHRRWKPNSVVASQERRPSTRAAAGKMAEQLGNHPSAACLGELDVNRGSAPSCWRKNWTLTLAPRKFSSTHRDSIRTPRWCVEPLQVQRL